MTGIVVIILLREHIVGMCSIFNSLFDILPCAIQPSTIIIHMIEYSIHILIATPKMRMLGGTLTNKVAIRIFSCDYRRYLLGYTSILNYC